MNAKRLGIIAGNGRFPIEVAKEVTRQDIPVFICAIKEETDPKIADYAEKILWVKLGELKKLRDFFRNNEIKEAIMAGGVNKTSLFKGQVKPDFEMIKLLAKSRNRSDDTLLASIASYLSEYGIKLVDSTKYLKNILPQEGVMGKKKPSRKDLEDINFAWGIAKRIADLDIGQTVVVKEKSVLAVESIEGTDAAIKRGGALGEGDVVVVKVARPRQDMRFDIPTVGLNTMNSLIKARANAIAFEAEKTIMLDKDVFIKMADQNKIAVISYKKT